MLHFMLQKFYHFFLQEAALLAPLLLQLTNRTSVLWGLKTPEKIALLK